MNKYKETNALRLELLSSNHFLSNQGLSIRLYFKKVLLLLWFEKLIKIRLQSCADERRPAGVNYYEFYEGYHPPNVLANLTVV